MKSAGRGASSPPIVGQSAYGPARLRALREERGHRASFAGHARPCSSPLIPCMRLAARRGGPARRTAGAHRPRCSPTRTPRRSIERRAAGAAAREEWRGGRRALLRPKDDVLAHPSSRATPAPPPRAAAGRGRHSARRESASPLAREPRHHEPAHARRARGRRQIWRPRDGDEQDFLTCPDPLHRLSGLPPRRAPPRIAPPRHAPRRGAQESHAARCCRRGRCLARHLPRCPVRSNHADQPSQRMPPTPLGYQQPHTSPELPPQDEAGCAL